ncbi:MAG: ABC transporter substrate-binding protein [Bacillati bacterium ANGP1]|uniref:ABC transporter substrate-binding protein n=1 Tax=Candidatus Segetimicrobium genomatis TaxID=2569760 RepID=A0A537JPI5_9BACT|nr:MAG: ABC transporter substrate-binding protein [Terrabacteria group bacterium ANGP1]
MWGAGKGLRWFLAAGVSVIIASLAVFPVRSGPKYGGSIRMSLADSDVTSFDPIVPFDNMSIWTMLHMYDQLVRVGNDGVSIEPDAADSWRTSPDGKTWVLHIRDGITFADGTPLTAADVKAALDRAGSKASNFEDNFTLISSATATDAHTLVVSLKAPSASFLAYASLYAASITPEKQMTAQGNAFWEHPVGSGPYVLSEWVKNPVPGRAALRGVDRRQHPDAQVPQRRAGHRHQRPPQPGRAAQARQGRHRQALPADAVRLRVLQPCPQAVRRRPGPSGAELRRRSPGDLEVGALRLREPGGEHAAADAVLEQGAQAVSVRRGQGQGALARGGPGGRLLDGDPGRVGRQSGQPDRDDPEG